MSLALETQWLAKSKVEPAFLRVPFNIMYNKHVKILAFTGFTVSKFHEWPSVGVSGGHQRCHVLISAGSRPLSRARVIHLEWDLHIVGKEI